MIQLVFLTVSIGFFPDGLRFLVRSGQFLFSFIALLESMGASKLAGKMIQLSLTNLSKSKFSMISYVRCFLETIQRLYLFSRCTKAGLLVRLLYMMKFLLTSLFFRVSSFCFNVSRSFFHGLNRFCTCDVKKHGCWDQFDL